MEVAVVQTSDPLESLREPWDRLSGGVPFRTSAWLLGWWQTYRPPGKLSVVTIRDDAGELIGVAPWYVRRRATDGRVVQMLGGGQVCSDYLTILAQPADTARVADALADLLARPADAGEPAIRFDALQLAGIDADDPLVPRLADRLCTMHNMHLWRRAAHNCWRVELPATWDDYLAMQSKSHRKQLRRLERQVLTTDRATLHRVEHPDQLDHAWRILVDLHQRRRAAHGQPSCFAAQRFARFHRRLADELLAAGMLRLYWLELDGRPAAVEYQLAGDVEKGDATIYAYQSGVDPDRLDQQPGQLITLATIAAAIDERRTAIDFLRGDEPYKAHWRAVPRPAFDYRIVPPRVAAQLRLGARMAATHLKSWVQGGLTLGGGSPS